MNDLYLNNAKDILENLEDIDLDIQGRIEEEDLQYSTWKLINSFKCVLEDYIEKLEVANNG